MKIRRLQSLVLATVLLVSSAEASLRVLVRFDAGEHQLQQVFRSAGVFSPSQSVGTGRVITLRWIDASGALLAVTNSIDPRVTHAPFSSAGKTVDFAGPAWVGLPTGAYLLDGPDQAVWLEIELPARHSPPLEAQLWRFNLTRP